MDPFKDIRPYTDAEVAEVLRSLTSNPSVLKALIGLQFPGVISNIPFVKFFIKQKLISKARTINTIDDYQQVFKGLMEKVCLLYTSPSPRDRSLSRMPSSA